MKIIWLGMLVLLTSGCINERAVHYYTQPEIDAIQSRAQCRALARNLVQMARCDGR